MQMKTFVTIKKLFLAIWIKTQSQKLAAKMNKMNVFGGFATKLNRNAEMIFCAFLEYMKKMKKIYNERNIFGLFLEYRTYCII